MSEWNSSKRGGETVLIVWELQSSMSYDWDITAIVLNARGEYALYSDGGCSCNGPYEMGWDEYDLAWTDNLIEVKRQAREYVGKSERISVGRKADNLSKLHKLSK